MHEGEVPEGWAPVAGAVRFEEKTVEVHDMTTRVFLVDDHEIVRRGLVDLLE